MYLRLAFIEALQRDVKESLLGFLPELILCAGIILLLLLRLFRGLDRLHLGWVALLMSLAALAMSCFQWTLKPTGQLFSVDHGLLVYDTFTVFLRIFLTAFAALVLWLCLLTGIPDREDSADFACLLLGATVGMCLMASANHLLMVYIGIEMASLPSYGLAGFLKGKRQGSEASLKYVVYGGGASGIMLYGISLLAGKFGTAYLPDLAHAYAAQPAGGAVDSVILLGTLFVLIGMAFKLAAVPFHFWCPDVFEGAAAEVAAFLSVASKGAALALTARLTLTLAGLQTATYANWADVARYLVPCLAVVAAVTATFGNLAAYPQTNLKRLLAYSTIAHAGYMLMGLATLSAEGVDAVLFYLIAYLFMNLGAFAVVAFIRNLTGSEDLRTYRGLILRSPLLTVLLAVFLLSLLGMPPLAGFAAKFQVFRVLFDQGHKYAATARPELGYTLYALLALGGLNTALSAAYYIRVLKVMILDRPLAELEGKEAAPLPVRAGPAVYGLVMALMIFVVGIAFGPLASASRQGAASFRSVPIPGAVATR